MKINMSDVKANLSDNILYSHAGGSISVKKLIELARTEKYLNKEKINSYMRELISSPLACHISDDDVALLEEYLQKSQV